MSNAQTTTMKLPDITLRLVAANLRQIKDSKATDQTLITLCQAKAALQNISYIIRDFAVNIDSQNYDDSEYKFNLMTLADCLRRLGFATFDQFNSEFIASCHAYKLLTKEEI